MKQTLISIDPQQFPEPFRALLNNADVYNSSSSESARVFFVDKDGGYYLKCAESGALRREAQMTRYFHTYGLSVDAEAYLSLDKDWLLTRKAEGEDCISEKYLSDPVHLCEVLAEIMYKLHHSPFADAPDYTEEFLRHIDENHQAGKFRPSRLFPVTDREEAWRIVQGNRRLLRHDTMVHGDFCLPNILLKDGHFSSFIDLDLAGQGDPHFDIYWCTWSLWYNLHTDRYRSCFYDAYGRQNFQEEMIRVLAAFEAFD